MKISILIIKTCKKVFIVALVIKSFTPLFKRILCIYHLVQSKKNYYKTQALINFDSEANAITLAYAANIVLKIWSTNVKA